MSRGEVDAGIGFASEAKGTPDVEVVYTVPRGEIKAVRYVAAPLRHTEQAVAAKAFVAWLGTPSVQTKLVAAGFLPAPAK